jgi:hypothetical protein
MDKEHLKRLTDWELCALFDRLFPDGFAGADVLAEIAPEGWEHSLLLACFHPSVEQRFEEQVAIQRNLDKWWKLSRRRKGTAALEPRPEPTLDDVRRKHEPSPVNQDEEITELVGLCLWDIFSDNHDVIAADGRVADIGSFPGAGAFLDEYLTRDQERWRDGDYMRFYMGTIWISRRADLTPVYAMIFRCDGSTPGRSGRNPSATCERSSPRNRPRGAGCARGTWRRCRMPSRAIPKTLQRDSRTAPDPPHGAPIRAQTSA